MTGGHWQEGKKAYRQESIGRRVLTGEHWQEGNGRHWQEGKMAGGQTGRGKGHIGRKAQRQEIIGRVALAGGHIGRRRKKKKEGWVDGGGWKDGWHISKRAHKQEGI